MAAALDEDQALEADEPVGWQPMWKRPRTPKSKEAKKRELRDQRRRLRDAAKRRLAARNSRLPRSRQNRIGNAAARRDARALSRLRHSGGWLR
jgi:flagellar motility protein MotE (MotC chaperone)